MTIPQNPPAHIPFINVTAKTVHIKRVDDTKENVAPVVVPALPAPVASMSTPPTTSRPKTRARSGSFSYFPGNTYASGNPAPESVKLSPSGSTPPTLARLPYNAQNGERIPIGAPTQASKSSTPAKTAAHSPYYHQKPEMKRASQLYSNSTTFNSLSSLTPIIPSSTLSTSITPSKVHREREAASKYLAGILLSRSNYKTPQRRRTNTRSYIKSSLSSSIGVDC